MSLRQERTARPLKRLCPKVRKYWQSKLGDCDTSTPLMVFVPGVPPWSFRGSSVTGSDRP